MTEPSPKEQPSRDFHSAVRSIISSLLLAIKMFSLYAADHAHCQKAIDRLHAEIEDFLKKRETLVLEVSNNQILYLGEVVHQCPAKDGELAFALFRDGIINLNWRLIAAPKPVLEYAVVHELCHLAHRNHTPSFWRMIRDLLPDYEPRREWLDEHGRRLDL